MKDETIVSIEELERAIREHNRLYFSQGQPLIGDETFDRMVERLRRLAPHSEVLEEIGSDFDDSGENLDKIVHGSKMLSLDKCYDDHGFSSWVDRVERELGAKGSHFDRQLIVSPKLDGLAARLLYDQDGCLVLAATRGDGNRGENILRQVEAIERIPKKIGTNGVEVRGEIFLPRSEFKRFSDRFSSARNLAAGAIKQKDPGKTASFGLSFFLYDIIGPTFESEERKLSFAASLGFPFVEYRLIEVGEFRNTFAEYVGKRESFDYDIDGVVFKINTIESQVLLGATTHHPKYAIAYKFSSSEAQSRIEEVIWSVGRSSVLTPVALIEPVNLAGAVIRRVSLHNLGMLKKLEISIGAKVMVARRGDVIPQIVEVTEQGGRQVEIPSQCPYCCSPTLIRKETKVIKGEEREYAFLYCSGGEQCASAAISAIEHFIKAIDCDGFGRKWTGQFFEAGILGNPVDLFRIRKEELLLFERMGETLAGKLIDNVNNARRMSLATFLTALGIKGAGRKVAETLADFGSIERLRAATSDELLGLSGIGPELAGAIVDGFTRKKDLIDGLLAEVILIETVRSQQGKLSGKSFVFTGTMNRMDRKNALKLVTKMGAKAGSSVTVTTDYLVVGDLDSPLKGQGRRGSKLLKAEQLIGSGGKIAILCEEDFLKLIEEDRLI